MTIDHSLDCVCAPALCGLISLADCISCPYSQCRSHITLNWRLLTVLKIYYHHQRLKLTCCILNADELGPQFISLVSSTSGQFKS